MFDFGIGEVEGGCDTMEGKKLSRGSGRLGGMISKEKCGCA